MMKGSEKWHVVEEKLEELQKIVEERLGHANIGITLDTYSHVLPGLQVK